MCPDAREAVNAAAAEPVAGAFDGEDGRQPRPRPPRSAFSAAGPQGRPLLASPEGRRGERDDVDAARGKLATRRRRYDITSFASTSFLTEARNVVLLGPPGIGKTHLATALGVAQGRNGHRVLFATATEWVTRMTDAHRSGRLPDCLHWPTPDVLTLEA